VGHRAGQDSVEKRKMLPLLGLELRPLGRSVPIQSLYRLLYPGSINVIMNKLFIPLPSLLKEFEEELAVLL
jgi:hypothetical protein